MKKFKNILNGETIYSGFYEYRKHRGTYGYMCGMASDVIFIFVNRVNDEIEMDILSEFKEIKNDQS